MATYDQLVNQNGTIFNQGARVAYNNANQLASDLGITADKIQWGNIAKAGADFNPTGYLGYNAPQTPSIPKVDVGNPTSSSLSQPPTTSFDLASLISGNQKKQDALFAQIAGFGNPSPEEVAAQQQYQDNQVKLNDVLNQQDSTQLNALAGINKIEDKPIPMEFITGQQDKVARDANLALQTLGVKANALTRVQQNALNVIANASASRTQKLEAAKFLYSANKDDLQNTIAIYKATAPENIGTQVNQATGDVYVITKNPLTGEIKTQVAGNVGAQKSYTSTQIIQDKNGQYVMVGIKADGTAETKPLGVQGTADTSKYLKLTDPNTGSDVYYDPTSGRIINPFAGNGAPSLGVSTGSMLGLPTYNTEASNPGVTRADRNNNPGNIKASSTSIQYPGVIGIESKPSSDGGNFLIFNSAEAGINAIGNLLQSKVYSGLTAEQAIKKYNGGGGYGASSVGLIPNKNFQEQISDPIIRNQVASAIAKAEGFTGIKTAQSNPDTQVIKNSLNAILPNLTDSGKQSARVSVNSLLSQGDEKGAANAVITTAISALPAQTKEKIYGKYTALNQLSEIDGLLKEFQTKGGDTNIFTGTQEAISQKLGNTSNPDLAYIGNRIQATLVAYRNTVSGAAFTESEKQDYTKMFPGIGKQGALNSALINSLKDSFNLDIRSNLQTIMGTGNYEKLQSVIDKANDPYVQYINELSNMSPEDNYINSLINPQPVIAGPQNPNNVLQNILNPTSKFIKSTF